MNSLPPNSLEAFAKTAEAVAATTKKLAKAALLGDYFALLDDDDLARAARYFSGQQFAQSEGRTPMAAAARRGEPVSAATGPSPEMRAPRSAGGGDGGDGALKV